MSKTAAGVRPTFFDSVEKWADIDFGEDLRHFLEDILYTELVSYAQLIHHKNAIIRSLLSHLADQSLSLPAFFDFCAAIATDLRDDFQPHFWQIFGAISNLFLTPKEEKFGEAEMEGGFRAMGQIIKLNLRFLSSQLKPLFCRSLLPLLGFPSDDRVRSFAARTFSFIFSNSPFPHKLAKFLLAKCFSGHGHTHHLKEGLSLFFFNSVFDDGEYEDKAAELIGAIILPIFGMPSDSALSRSSISLMTDVFQKFIACGNRSVSTQIIAKLISRVEHVQNANELRTLSQWLLLWMRAKKSALFNKDNKAKLFSLVVDGLQSSDCPEFFEQYLQLVSELLLSHPPPSPLHQSTFLSVLATLGNDLHRLHFLLRCLAQLHTLPFFFTDIMDVVGRLGSSLLSSITSDFKNITQERLQPLRELLIFYSQILTEHFPIEEPLSANRQELSFCLQHHCSLRHFVVAVLHNPSVYPSDFFDLSLTIWPHLWFINEKPEGIDAINAFVMQTVREGTKRTLSEKETERLWKATCAALILQQK